MATNKTKQKATGTGGGELSITCGKDLMLIAPHRLVLEGKNAARGEIRLTRGPSVSVP